MRTDKSIWIFILIVCCVRATMGEGEWHHGDPRRAVLHAITSSHIKVTSAAGTFLVARFGGDDDELPESLTSDGKSAWHRLFQRFVGPKGETSVYERVHFARDEARQAKTTVTLTEREWMSGTHVDTPYRERRMINDGEKLVSYYWFTTNDYRNVFGKIDPPTVINLEHFESFGQISKYLSPGSLSDRDIVASLKDEKIYVSIRKSNSRGPIHNRIELILNPKYNMAVEEARLYLGDHLWKQDVFTEYAQTGGRLWYPGRAIMKTYRPTDGGPRMVSRKEYVLIGQILLNDKLGESEFIPHLPRGAKLTDFTQNPPRSIKIGSTDGTNVLLRHRIYE